MGLVYYYNLKEYGDTLYINLKDEKPNREVGFKDLAIFYKNDEIVQIHVNNISQIFRIHSKGRIVFPPKTLIDYVNSKLKQASLPLLNYCKDSGFIVGKVVSILNDEVIVDIGIKQTFKCAYKNIKENDLIVVSKKGTMMFDCYIEESVIKGTISSGEICSSYYLGIDEEKEKALILCENEAQVGQDFFIC